AFELDPTLGHPLVELEGLGWSKKQLLDLAQKFMHCGGLEASDCGLNGGDRITYDVDQWELTSDGHLTVQGWAFSDAGIQRVRVLIDNIEAGEAELGRRRPDIERDYPTVPSAGRSGFALQKELERPFSGYHRLLIIVRSADSGARSNQILVRATR